ncbi:auxin-responsive protein SAUR68 [Ziziphus jujuba]|uniref:Auxin-responsive protein SAUR68 n=1 Tax=Ziziphus jujuba TaxID=326968 RepID=A0A6P4AF43_ZIZJJ|nr:auxin-responsive protein SAUR68 [Ziziphus jujuba]
MISPKKLIRMARKWQKLAVLSRKRISIPRTTEDMDAENSSKLSMVDKGHFVIYTEDQKRFVMPLAYLNNDILRKLFKMSEEEFGLSSNGPIILPCDSTLMEYVVMLIRRGIAKDLEKALLKSVDTSRCSLSSSFHQGDASHPSLICGY